MRSIARSVHTTVARVKKLAGINNIVIDYRPSKIGVSMKQAIVKLAESGMTANDIAARKNISAGAVEQIIGQQVGLVERRKAKRFEELKQEHRAKLANVLNEDLTRTQIRKLASGSYLYLYKNDREWLYAKLPPATARSKRRKLQLK